MSSERMTKRNYYGKAYVPGYAPRCGDDATKELLCKVTERLAFLEDLIEKNQTKIPEEMTTELKKEGIIV